jgi:predicted secreted protein
VHLKYVLAFTVSREKRAESMEQRAESREQRAKQRAEGRIFNFF